MRPEQGVCQDRHGKKDSITTRYRQATLGREADARFSLRIGCSSGHGGPVTMSVGQISPLMAATSAGYRLDTGYRVR